MSQLRLDLGDSSLGTRPAKTMNLPIKREDDRIYEFGVSKDTDPSLWTVSGIGGPSIAEFFGLTDKRRVTGKTALQQAAALICVDVLAQDISKATLRLRKKVKGGYDFVDDKQHPMARFLAMEPNQWHTWTEFVQMLIYHLVMSSNCFAYARRNRVGDVLSLIPLATAQVCDAIDPDSKQLFYEINAVSDYQQMFLGTDYIIAPARDVMHVRQRLLNGFTGFSTIRAGRTSLRISDDLQRYQEKLYGENGLSTGVFVRKEGTGNMTDEVFRRTKEQLKKLMARVNDRGEPILLEDGIKYEKMDVNAQESEMIEALDKAIERVCQLWRMPPHKAMHLGAVKYENLATLEKIYVRDTLEPICRMFEGRMNKLLLSDDERMTFGFWFDRDEMSVFDDKTETDRVTKLYERGIISKDEARADQGYNPMPKKGGQVYSLPANTKLIDDNMETVATGASEKPDNNAANNAKADGEGDGESDTSPKDLSVEK